LIDKEILTKSNSKTKPTWKWSNRPKLTEKDNSRSKNNNKRRKESYSKLYRNVSIVKCQFLMSLVLV